MSAWVIPTVVFFVSLLVATLVPQRILEEALQHAFLLIREPAVMVRDWAHTAFQQTWVGVNTGLVSLGLTRHNWARRAPLLLFLGTAFFVGLGTFVGNLIPTFAGLFGHGGQILRHIPLELFIAAELAAATLGPGIILTEILGITHLGLESETLALRPATKVLLSLVLVGILSGSVYLTYSSGLVRARAFAFDPTINQHQEGAQAPSIILGSTIEKLMTRTPPPDAKPNPERQSQGQAPTGGQLNDPTTTLFTWLPVLSLCSGAVAFLAVPHTVVLLLLGPIFAIALIFLGLAFCVGSGMERVINAGYNAARGCLGVLGHLGGQIRRAAGFEQEDDLPTDHTVSSDVGGDSTATTRESAAAPAEKAASSGSMTASDSRQGDDSAPGRDDDPGQPWNPLGIGPGEENERV